jgi:DNA-binding NarL/FixJ family response regulator
LSWKAKSRHSAQQIRQAIDLQFDEWGLSPSEKDVALFLIKGLSMKEIAHIRETQDKTVRQQATQIYKKADVSGRQELSAFFLEDIVATPDS